MVRRPDEERVRGLGGALRTPTRIDSSISASGCGLKTTRAPRRRAISAASGRSGRRTVTTSATPAAKRVSRIVSSTVERPKGRRIFSLPIRRESPAAGTTAARPAFRLPLILLSRRRRGPRDGGSAPARPRSNQRRVASSRSIAPRRASRRKPEGGADSFRRRTSSAIDRSYWREEGGRRSGGRRASRKAIRVSPRPSKRGAGGLREPALELPPAGRGDPVEVAAGPLPGAEHPQEDETRPPQPGEGRVDLGDLGAPEGSDVSLADERARSYPVLGRSERRPRRTWGSDMGKLYHDIDIVGSGTFGGSPVEMAVEKKEKKSGARRPPIILGSKRKVLIYFFFFPPFFVPPFLAAFFFVAIMSPPSRQPIDSLRARC